MTKTSKILSMLAMASLLAPQFAAAGENKGSIYLDTRTDLQVNMFNDDASVTTGPRSNNETFNIQRLRLDVKGSLNDDSTTYRFRYNFLKANSAPDATTGAQTAAQDSGTAAIDHAWVAHQMGDFNLAVGKQASGAEGYIGTVNFADVYSVPVAITDMLTELYVTGASLNYTFLGTHNLRVFMGDPTIGSVDTIATNTTHFANNNRNLYTVRYYSTIDAGDVKIMPVVNYMSEGFQVATVGANRSNTQIDVGGRVQFAPWEVDVEYTADTFNDRTIVGVNDTTTSIYGVVRYKFASGLKPFVQYENAVQQIGVSTTQNKKNTSSIIGAGLEYYPSADQDFRYHIAYISNATAQDPGGGGTVANQNGGQIFAGVKLYTDILKK